MIKAVVLGIDLPFSILFDTILLPYKTYLIINEEDELVITKSTNKT